MSLADLQVSRTDPTVLKLVGVGVPPYSARGLSQTLEPIDASIHIERTINGELINLGYDPMRKYKSEISGSDQRPPAVDGIWPGHIVTVDCIVTISHPEYGAFGREPVDYDDSLINEAGYVTYRPRLTMMVMNFSVDEDEYGAQIGWKLSLEEV